MHLPFFGFPPFRYSSGNDTSGCPAEVGRWNPVSSPVLDLLQVTSNERSPFELSLDTAIQTFELGAPSNSLLTSAQIF